MRKPHYAAAAAAALVVGCGGGGDKGDSTNADRYQGEQRNVAAAIDQFAEAGYDGDGQKICTEIFSVPLQKNIERESGHSCAAEVEDNLKKGAYSLEVNSVHVNGPAASAAVTDQDGNRSVLHLVKLGAAWRIQQVKPG